MTVKHLITLTGIALAAGATAQTDDDDTPPDPMANVVIEATEIRNGLYLLTGRGGNLGLSVGADATFIVDDQFAPLTDRINAAIAEITDRPVDYVLNTHWHFDHTGGNENLGESGALILAHDNVRKRMAAGQTIEAYNLEIDPAPEVALPVVTFNDTLSLHINDLTIRGLHVHHAHTDGDTIVHFVEANVVHMGDTFFNGLYPFIDLSSGGDINGMIKAADKVLALADDDTVIIPGHGPLADREDLTAFRTMLASIRDRVSALREEGQSLEEVLAEKPSADFDATANRFGFLTPDQFVATVYSSLAGE